MSPDGQEARRAAREELDKAIYQHEPGIFHRAFRWIGERIYDIFSAPGSPSSSTFSIVILAALIVAIALSLIFFTRIRATNRQRPGHRESARLFADDADSTQLFARAANYAAQAHYTQAFREQFRAIIRFADERALIADRPGLTAQEAAAALADLERDYARSIVSHADLFDAASYGDLVLTEQHYLALVRLIDIIKPRLTQRTATNIADEIAGQAAQR